MTEHSEQWTIAVVIGALVVQSLWQRSLLKRSINHLSRKLDTIMALVSVDQSVLDAIGTELGAIADAVQELVDNPDVPLDAADLSVITAPVARMQEALTAPEEPVQPPADPEPPAEPETPVAPSE